MNIHTTNRCSKLTWEEDTMRYADMLRQAIERQNLSLAQVLFRLAKRDICMDKSVLSKLQNGKLPPAKDETNIVLADALGIDPTEFRIAAAREILPESLFELIRDAS
jgi:transcriptional regulator with XRE-family HTH domain